MIRESPQMKIDLCCGPKKQIDHIGVDILNFKGVDIVHDLNEGIPFDDNVADYIYAHDAIEHLKDRIFTMFEIWRVLKDGGEVDILVPSTDGRGAFQDFTHVSYWNENSFKYFINNLPFLDYYRGKILFECKELYTTEFSADSVKHVVFRGNAVKNPKWLNDITIRLRNLNLKQGSKTKGSVINA